MRQCFQEVVRGKSVPWLGRWAVRCHSGSGELRGLPKGLRLSEAEDWLGREASRPSEDPGGPGENARSWEALGEARPGQSSLSAGALR